ncbi:MAG: LysR substrate-binding domain-containing protein [Polyangiales bacterium]
MESLVTIESFVPTAQKGTISPAPRTKGVTPAAVSKNVAALEAGLGVRLFQRSTRRLTLTEPGERFLSSAGAGLASLQAAVDDLRSTRREPSGRLRMSVPVGLGREYVLPMLPAFMERHPQVEVDVSFDNRQVDLVGEGFDVAIGGSLDLGAGIVARVLAPAHVIAAASPAYLEKHGTPRAPAEMAQHDGILMRSILSGRLRAFVFRNSAGEEATLPLRRRLVLDDMEAICTAARLGLGIGTMAPAFAYKFLESGELVRVLPKWYADTGSLSIYYASQKLVPAKTRAFVDHVLAYCKRDRIAARVRAG